MKEYLILDTNIYLQCSLYTEKKEDEKILSSLISLLDQSKIVLLLPEIIELEYRRALKIKLYSIKTNLEQIKNAINEKVSSPQIKRELLDSVDSSYMKREKNVDKAEKIIEKLFKHKNTKKIVITPEIVSASYLRGISGIKPYKNSLQREIQSDCVIIETLKAYLLKIKGYKLYLCTNNIRDFGLKKVIKKFESWEIHPDIEKEFVKIILYRKLHEFLQEKYKAKISEKDLTVSRIPATVLESSIASLDISNLSADRITDTAVLDYMNGLNVLDSITQVSKCKNCEKTEIEISLDPITRLCSDCSMLGIYTMPSVAVTSFSHCKKCKRLLDIVESMTGSGICSSCKGFLI